MTQDISAASSLLLLYNETFAYKDFSPIRMWLNEGCDMEKDIIPAMKDVMARKKDILSVSYFAPAIYRYKQQRLDTEAAKARLPQKEEKSEAYYMSIYAWKRSKGIQLTDEQIKQLESYENKNGRVSA